jgi:P-type Ca2+ transporter type 2C
MKVPSSLPPVRMQNPASQQTGLSSAEVLSSREKHGSNQSELKEKSRFFTVLIDVVFEPMFIILLLSSLLYFILGKYQEGVIMLVAIIIVSGISIFQESKSRSAVEALKNLTGPRAKVIRNSDLIQIQISEIVLGDIIIVEDGDTVPADAILLKANDFSVNESMLTGESLPLYKGPDKEDKLIYKGTMVLSGSATAEVSAIGKSTKLGTIGDSLIEIEEVKTPLQLQIKKFILSMLLFGLLAFVVVCVLNYIETGNFIQSLLSGLTLAMSVIPEEIPVAYSTFMALGAYHLYKKMVIARNPHRLESLGAASVICTDKTGTITENKMVPAEIYELKIDTFFALDSKEFQMNEVLEYAMWSSETEPFDPMEKAIHELYSNKSEKDSRKDFQMFKEYPLEGENPIMTHVFSNQTENKIAVKGSVEGVLKQCSLSDEEKANFLTKANSLASKGHRVLAVGKAEMDKNQLPEKQDAFRFILLGLISFYDPPKSNMKDVMTQFYKAGIRVLMITGDHPETAKSIANQIEMKGADEVMIGTELMNLSDEELKEKAKSVSIYARMFPEAKLRIVEALKSNGEIVAMTGDGVNDAPALKAAHIGIAMGKRGSEVARNIATLVLADDDFSHMPEAISLGRRIYDNLKKAIRYIISIHIPIIMIVTLPLILFWKYTNLFLPIHVIFLELIMGPTCSIIYENEPIEPNTMARPPRDSKLSFFSFRELSVSILQGCIITIACLSLGYYYIQQDYSEAMVRTIVYMTLIFSNLFLTLENRSFRYSIFTTIQYKNRLIPMILALSLIIPVLSLFVTPIRQIFEFEIPSLLDMFNCFAAAFIGVMWIEIYKYIRRIGGTAINRGEKNITDSLR